MIGARAEAIQRVEDREKFKATMEKIGLDTCRESACEVTRRSQRNPP